MPTDEDDPIEREITRDRETGADKGTVPYHRLAEVAGERRAARADAAAARARLAELETTAKAWETERSELEGLRKERATWAEERALLSAGLADEEGQVVARTLYQRLPEQGRPPISEWLGGLKKEPGKAPRSLQPFLQAPTDPATAKEPVKPPTLGDTRGGQTTAAPTEGRLSPDQIRSIRTKALKTGDWSEWKKVAHLA